MTWNTLESPWLHPFNPCWSDQQESLDSVFEVATGKLEHSLGWPSLIYLSEALKANLFADFSSPYTCIHSAIFIMESFVLFTSDNLPKDV